MSVIEPGPVGGQLPLKSTERRALDALARANTPLSKGQLARLVYGEVTGSTQALMTRITQVLKERDLIEERQEGRIKHVALTEEGRRVAVRKSEQPAEPFSREILLTHEIKDTIPTAVDTPRPRSIKHMHAAAVVAANALVQKGKWSRSDERFAQALYSLMDDPPDQAAGARRDLTTIRGLAEDWPQDNLWRAALVELLAQLEDDDERASNAERLAGELLRLGRDCLSTPETALLWSAGTGCVLGPLRASDRGIASLRQSLVEGLRASLRRCEGLNRGMAKYWRARSLAALGSYRAAQSDWPRLGSFVGSAGHDALSRAAATVTRGVLASGEVNVQLITLDQLETALLLPLVEEHHRPLPQSPLESIGTILEDVDTWATIWNQQHAALCMASEEFRKAVEAVRTLPDSLPSGVSAHQIAEVHAFRSGNTHVPTPEALGDGEVQRILTPKLELQVRDNLWSKAMVLGYVSAIHRDGLIVENELS